MLNASWNLVSAQEQSSTWTRNNDVCYAEFYGRQLTSHFQPIFDLKQQQLSGYEGLVRAWRPDGTQEAALELFTLPRTSREMLELDRLCRNLHAQNFTRQTRAPLGLFVNLNSQCLISEQPDIGFTRSLLERNGLHPSQLVIEILENEVNEPARLKHFIDHFRHLGCQIAIDDFGAGYSNFDRIWRLEPDIVKIDRHFVQRATHEDRVARMLRGVVGLLHETGCHVVLEGIETAADATTAVAVQADLVQGYYFARPHPELLSDLEIEARLRRVLHLL